MKTPYETYEIAPKVQFLKALLNPMDTTRIGNEFIFNLSHVERIHGETNLFRITCQKVSDDTHLVLLVEVLEN